MAEYKSLQIRDIILNCDKNFSEFYPLGDIPYIHYFSNHENRFVELKMHERYQEEEIEKLCNLIGISVEQFKNLYKKAKRHKF